MLRPLRYLLGFIPVPLVVMAFMQGGLWVLALPAYAFGLVPLLDALLPIDTLNMDPDEEAKAKANPLFAAVLYLAVPLQWAMLGLFLWSIPNHSVLELLGATWTMGIACGAYGINAAHELGHRPKAHEKWMSKALLLTTLYLHFFIEHNRGHHVKVATPDDPASAQRGELLYTFWIRTVRDSFIDAWRLEAERLDRKGQSPWTPANQMLRFLTVEFGLVALITVVFGPIAVLAFMAASLLGILTLETVNYVEHYGLARAQTASGRYERVLPIHSWNADHVAGRVMLFELTRHSDHHAHAARPYGVLRSMPGAPQLPTGYPGCMLMSFVPPLWFRVMHPRLDALADGVV